MNNDNISKYAQSLAGITAAEWKKLCFLVDRQFDRQIWELERELQLPEKINLEP